MDGILFVRVICVSSLRDGTCRANCLARTAIQAGIRIDLVLRIALRDSSCRALACTCSAADACVRNYISHVNILLIPIESYRRSDQETLIVSIGGYILLRYKYENNTSRGKMQAKNPFFCPCRKNNRILILVQGH